jgi:Cu-Zn family superoxide dismutase
MLSVALGAVLIAALTIGGASARSEWRLRAPVKAADGSTVGKVLFKRTDDGKVVVRALLAGLTPGFHGFHVHTAGICDPAATDTANNPAPFFTAGGHYNPATTAIHGEHAGDMPSLLVAQDGTALLRFTTDRFRLRDLMDEDGSAVIVHTGMDNYANIPAATATGAERYHSHVEDIFGPDTPTKATGDAGARFGCGVVTRIGS